MKKQNPIYLYLGLYLLCFFVRTIDVLWLEYNPYLKEISLTKIVGIIIIASFLLLSRKRLSEIGINKKTFVVNAFLGLLLMGISLSAAYSIEYLALMMQGLSPYLQISAIAFDLSPEMAIQGALFFGVVLVASNIVNSTMEEGLFRGVMLSKVSRNNAIAMNIFQATLFGLWHIIWPIRAVLEGTMGTGEALLTGIGYFLLSGSIGYGWGILFLARGSLWPSWFAHTLNNTILNLIHIGSAEGINTMLNIRVFMSTALFLSIVLIIKNRITLYDKKQQQSFDKSSRIVR